MKAALITNCSHTRTIPPVVRVQDMPIGLTMQQALAWWCEQLGRYESTITAGELYRGISFSTLANIMEKFAIPPNLVRIVTGGQGLIDLTEKIVPYDFTASAKEEYNIHQHVTSEPFVQTVWWRMINQKRYSKLTPVATYIEDSLKTNDIVVIALTKVFLRYISEDFLSTSPALLQRVRILLSASSVGSVPAQLRSYIIPFDRYAIAAAPGNRNDTNHRAALKFLTLAAEDPNFLTLSNVKQAEVINGNSFGGVSVGSTQGTRAEINIEQILRDTPTLLEMDSERAYTIVRRLYGAIGGRMNFRGIHRKLTQKPLEDGDDLHIGAEILAGMNLKPVAPAIKADNEDTAIMAIRVFVSAASALGRDISFTTEQIILWATEYFRRKGEELPDVFTEQKLPFLLRSNLDALGIQAGAQQSTFTLKR